MAKGIYEREGKNGDVTYYIRYQADGTDIKERQLTRFRRLTWDKTGTFFWSEGGTD